MDSGTSAILMQRVSVLEDLMRRSEANVGQMLQRMKETEIAVSQVAKAQERQTPEVRYVYDEVAQLKRQLASVDQSWRQTYQDFSANVQQELRGGRIAQQVEQVVAVQRTEQAQARNEIQEMQQLLRRVTEQWSSDQHDVRQVAQTTAWKADQLQMTVSQLTSQCAALDRRVEGSSQDLRNFATEVERNASSFRQFVEAAVRAAHQDAIQRVELEQRARDALQADVQSTVHRLREDVIRGLAQASATCKVLEDNASALETVLRAEVRTRIQKTDELTAALFQLRNEQDEDTTVAAEALQELDADGNVISTAVLKHRADIDRLAAELRDVKVLITDLSNRPNRAPTVLAAAPAPRQEDRGPTTRNSDQDSNLMVVDLEEPYASEPDDLVSDEMRQSGVSPAVTQRIIKMMNKLRSKASLLQVRYLKEAMFNAMRQHVHKSFVDMAEKLDADQQVLEQHLSTLRNHLTTIEGRFTEQDARIEALQQRRSSTTSSQQPPQPTATGGSVQRTSSMRSVSSSASSPAASNQSTPRQTNGSATAVASRAASSATSTTSGGGANAVPVRKVKPPPENRNVMKQL